MGTSSINGPFSMAMLNNQMVYIYICTVASLQMGHPRTVHPLFLYNLDI